MYRSILATALVAAAANMPASAQQFDNNKAVAAYSFSSISPVLQAIGATSQNAQAEDGTGYMRVTAPNGFGFNIALAACEGPAQQNCKGMAMAAIWNDDNKFTAQQIAANIQQFNLRYRFTSAGLRPDGKPYIQRYAIADFGTNQGNIRAEIEAFIAIGSIFHSEALGNG